ncbi:zinc ABC transporter substrate-binding protein [Ignisphaera sp. 4213-co]|uniref:Zinc ABC transporter substrate-binding protein n=1 Tax=Ignisphaera cupida TaxID=3050454 RepID=A0ABD4Z735_9CREN|nr:zinc ABC transporter substrate-binding protein [Ignisphaera sp. 4213-co]MDK6028944.1 zinc ABC transporter substrate-binding protein [Ignisphaera sp. 4213-co]
MKNQSLVSVTLLIIVTAIAIAPHTVAENSNGLTIVVTFPFLYNDIKMLVCQGDTVISLVKPGIDPHEYQLTPSDVDVLRKADLIVSTAHTAFEMQIENLVKSGEVKAKLVEIPRIPNITFLIHPQTGKVNYHGLLLYPKNYVSFIIYLESVLKNMRRSCADVYRRNMDSVLTELRKLDNSTRKLTGFLAIIDVPKIQYVVKWLELNISYILLKDEETPITPQDYQNIEIILKTNRDVVVIGTQGSSACDKLRELANAYGKPFLAFPNPLIYNGSLDYLKSVSQIVNSYNITFSHTKSEGDKNFVVITTTALAVAILVIILVFIARRSR